MREWTTPVIEELEISETRSGHYGGNENEQADYKAAS